MKKASMDGHGDDWGCKSQYECVWKLLVQVGGSSSYVVLSTRDCVLGCWTRAAFTSFHLDTTSLAKKLWFSCSNSCSDQLDVLFVVVHQWIFHIWNKQTTNMWHVKFNSSKLNFLSDQCTRHSLCATWTPATWTDLNNFQLHLPVVTCRWLATYLPFHRFLRLPIQSIACMYSPKRT